MMSMRGLTMLLVLSTIPGSEASALESVLSSSSNRGASGRCNAVRVEAVQKTSDESGPRRRYRDRFSAEDVLDLRFVVSLPANNQAGLVEIKLYTPSGRLYDVLRAEADGGEATGRSSNRRRRSRTVAAQLPIAGSHITGRSLYGEWEARVYLDGNDEECNRKAYILDP
jgi:hypothetical protein